MAKLPRLLVLASFLVLIPLSHLHPQTSTTAPANGSVAAAPSAPSAQAPDEMTKKITELVLAGKYAEAQKLTEGLLIAYPDDQRLIKAKVLIDSRLAPGGSTSAAPGSAQPTQPASNAGPTQLTGMDKIDYTALIELAREGKESTDLNQQNALLKQFMDQSRVFLQKHPEQTLLWELRAQAAISLNELIAGYQAGQKLMAAGASDSNDSTLLSLLGKLKNKGWLDKQRVEKLYEQQRYILVTFPGPLVDAGKTELTNEINAMLQSRYPSRQVYYSTPAMGDAIPILTVTINVHDALTDPCTSTYFQQTWNCPAHFLLDVTASIPNGWQFNKSYTFHGGTSGVYRSLLGPSYTDFVPLTTEQWSAWYGQQVMPVLKEILDADAVHTALVNLNPDPADWASGSPASASDLVPEPGAPSANSAQSGNNPPAAPVPPAPSPAIVPAPKAAAPVVQNAVPVSTPVSTPPAVSVIPAPVPIPAASAPASATAILHLYRLSHMAGEFSLYEIQIDGRQVARIANAQSLREDLPPGKHNINAFVRGARSDTPLYDLEMESGKEYWIRIDLAGTNGFITHMRLALVPEAEAREESGKLKEAANGNLPDK